MGLIEKVRGKRISVDTAPFIYFIEKNPDYMGLVKPIFSGIDNKHRSGYFHYYFVGGTGSSPEAEKQGIGRTISGYFIAY